MAIKWMPNIVQFVHKQKSITQILPFYKSSYIIFTKLLKQINLPFPQDPFCSRPELSLVRLFQNRDKRLVSYHIHLI